jgi:hypothetical protein
VSTDWNVHCVDCNMTHGFDDANHQAELMAIICKNADAIAALAPFLAEAGDVKLQTFWGQIDVHWFATHKGHRIVPINEYGDLLTACAERIVCACGYTRRCNLEHGHDGGHAPKDRR